jgi:hypothetical protein
MLGVTHVMNCASECENYHPVCLLFDYFDCFICLLSRLFLIFATERFWIHAFGFGRLGKSMYVHLFIHLLFLFFFFFFAFVQIAISHHFEEAHKFIDAAKQGKGKILIHCMGKVFWMLVCWLIIVCFVRLCRLVLAGVSRSATITISYVMKTKNLTLKESFKYVKQRRSVIWPNGGFVEQVRTKTTWMNNKSYRKKRNKQ